MSKFTNILRADDKLRDRVIMHVVRSQRLALSEIQIEVERITNNLKNEIKKLREDPQKYFEELDANEEFESDEVEAGPEDFGIEEVVQKVAEEFEQETAK